MRATNDRAARSRAALVIRLRALLESLERNPATRPAARAASLALVRAALRGVARAPAVRAAYARGSHGRGDFMPLTSDLDLAVVLREPNLAPDFAATAGVLAALDRLRRWNPLVRDAWQMLLGDTDWPLVERYPALFQVGEWRGLDGRGPEVHAAEVDERLVLAARWNRLHLWTDSALRHVLAPAAWSSVAALEFAAAEKKAAALAAALAGTPAPRRRRPPPADAAQALARTSDLVGRLEDGASLVAQRAGLAPPAPPFAAAATDDAERALVAALRRAPEAARLHAAVVHSGMVAVVTRDALPAGERATLLRALRPIASELRRRFFVYSPLSFAMAPVCEPVRVVAVAADPAPPDEAAPAEPLLLREQLLYESLFACSELRTTAARPAGDPGLAYLTRRFARLLLYLEQGRLERDGAAALAAVAAARPDVGRLLADAAAVPADRRRRFDADAALCVALVRAVERLAPQRGRADLPLPAGAD